jgi:predicted nuclease with TOPRIM domain
VKKRRNYHDTVLPHVGVKKLEELIKEGITNAKDLVEHPGVPDSWCRNREQTRTLERIQSKAAQIFTERNNEVKRLETAVRELEEPLAAGEMVVAMDLSVHGQMLRDGEIATMEEAGEPKAPLFTSMLDPKGYNAKVL